MTHNKMRTALGMATAALAAVTLVAAPQAIAKTKKAAKANHTEHMMADSRAEALEAQVNQLTNAVQALQSELSRVKSQAGRPDPDTAKVQELEDWVNHAKTKEAKAQDKNNLVFFRGGFSHFDSERGGTLDPTAAGGASGNGGALNGTIGNQDSFYFGAGFDWDIAEDLFGLFPGTDLYAELRFDYIERGNRAVNGLASSTVATLNSVGFNLPAANTESATVNQLSLSASPKIKFLKGHDFRPWLIPVGFEINVISPPSDAITVLTPGMQFGLGADYRIWKSLYVGADARYHYAPGNVDGVNTNGLTAGGYVGFGF